ncbi:50S ribosomal protein L29 [Christensenellaceae bacterium OttesenSCG-928-L17]|nr:50S ribosomal protein L29 [Christensenellaceae bacterium OttesenSCG-928-L17]
MAKTEKTVTKKTDIKELSLEQQLVAKRAELLEAQKNLGGTLQNPHVIKKIKKEIARILTKSNATKGEK